MKHEWYFLILLFMGSLSISWFMKGYALRCSLIDLPGDRSSHALPTPRGGGVSIVIVFIIGLVILTMWKRIPFDFFLALIVSGLIVAAVGFCDDHGHIPAHWRILTHFLASGWVVFWLGGVPPLDMGFVIWKWGWFGNVVTVVGLVWLLNLYNFMDGIDAIAGAEAIFVSLAAIVLVLFADAGDFALVLGVFLAGVAGFLIWNLPPAKIFMGDVGSGFIGLVIGVMTVFSFKRGLVPVWTWLILLGVFIVDATTTLIRRLLHGECWYEAHCSHAYQNAARYLRSHGKVTLIVTVINIFWLFPLAMLSWRLPRVGFLLAILALAPLVLLAVRLDLNKRGEI